MIKINKQNGSAIIWILIAVGLFAALGYAFSNSSRTSTALLTNTEAESYANQIIVYGNEIKSTIKRMQLRGVDATEFDFGNNIFKFMGGALVTATGHNPNCTTSKCQIFSVNGGGIQPTPLPNTALSLIATGGSIEEGHWNPFESSLDGIGTSESDIFYAVSYLSLPVCLKINKILGIANSTSAPPTVSGSIGQYNGILASSSFPTTVELFGKTNYCYVFSGSPEIYNYLHVVLPR